MSVRLPTAGTLPPASVPPPQLSDRLSMSDCSHLGAAHRYGSRASSESCSDTTRKRLRDGGYHQTQPRELHRIHHIPVGSAGRYYVTGAIMTHSDAKTLTRRSLAAALTAAGTSARLLAQQVAPAPPVPKHTGPPPETPAFGETI